MFFIVQGTGTLRYGNEPRKIRAGDVICCPTGGPETAHQIVPERGYGDQFPSGEEQLVFVLVAMPSK